MHPLGEKVALITGGSSGIGRATALRLASYGARVVVVARNRTALDEVVCEIQKATSPHPLSPGERGAGSVQALAVTADVTQADACRRAVEATISQFGQLDILLCSAGLSMRTYFENSDLAAMEQVVRVNFLGTLYATHFALPHIKKSKGSLVAMSSLTGLRGIPSYSLYGATKFAVQGLYDSLRLELGRDGVHVGVVSPGFVDTPLRDHVLGPDGQVWPNPPDPPFRIWPVEKCVVRIVRLIV
jgi:NAD(P)-dependent dehydrogenase (short-subunit alcohol dehydrogenase family)